MIYRDGDTFFTVDGLWAAIFCVHSTIHVCRVLANSRVSRIHMAGICKFRWRRPVRRSARLPCSPLTTAALICQSTSCNPATTLHVPPPIYRNFNNFVLYTRDYGPWHANPNLAHDHSTSSSEKGCQGWLSKMKKADMTLVFHSDSAPA